MRGFQPWPNAYTNYEAGRLVIRRAQPEKADAGPTEHGAILKAHGDELCVACGDATLLRLQEVQPEGKRRMNVRDFLNGARLNIGSRLG